MSIFKEVFKDNELYIAKNPNCPPELLVEILKRDKDDYVSCLAARNPNCPPRAKIEWMRNTGQIEKEDPTKHIIEYEPIKNYAKEMIEWINEELQK